MARPPYSFRRKNRTGTKRGGYIYYDKYPQRVPRAPRLKTKYLTALANPFHPNSYGIRIPDSNTVPSQSFYSLETQQITSSATAGWATAQLYFPNLQYQGANGIGTSGTVWGWGANYLAQDFGNAQVWVNTAMNYSAIRPVAHGIKITAIQALTAITGTLHYGYGPMVVNNQVTWTGPVSIAQMQRLTGYGRVAISSLSQKPLVLVNRPLDVTSQRYVAPGDTQLGTVDGGFDFANQWCCIYIAIEGASPVSTAILEIDSLIHYEGIVATAGNAGIISTGQDAEPYNPTVIGAAAHMLADSSPTINEDADWDAIAVKALDAFESATQGAVGGYASFGIPGAVAGGLYGAVRGYVRGGGGASKRSSARRKQKLNAMTSSITNTRRYLKY